MDTPVSASRSTLVDLLLSEHVTAQRLLLAAGAGAAAVWTALGVPGQALFWLMVLDFLTGVLAAGREGVITSRVGLRGLRRKAVQWLVIAAVYAAQATVPGVPAAQFVAGAMAAMEFVSILENAARLGAIPPVLVEWLRKRLALTSVPAVSAVSAVPAMPAAAIPASAVQPAVHSVKG